MRQIFSPFLSPFRFSPILRQFVRRDILGRYRGSLLGMGWAFVTPILMLGVYTFVFVGVFRARWPGAEDGSGITFALQLFAGLMVFNLFAEVTAQAPNLILSQPNLVKKVVFPLEILPFVALGSGLFHLMLSLGVLLVGALFVNHGLPWTVLLLPLVLLPLLPLLLGIGWFFAALGVFVRDIAQVISLGINLLMFLSPIFYSTSSLSPSIQSWMFINPLAPVIENVRLVVFVGEMPDWSNWALSLGVSLLGALFGSAFFQATRREFSDVL